MQRERSEGLDKFGRADAMKRMNRTMAIGDKYVRNIAQSKSFANAIYGGKGVDVARSRQYSQNTYMGYNNG